MALGDQRLQLSNDFFIGACLSYSLDSNRCAMVVQQAVLPDAASQGSIAVLTPPGGRDTVCGLEGSPLEG